MIAVAPTIAEVVVAVAMVVAAVVVLWRWPGLLVGLAVALALWTVAPWLSWLALAVVVAISVGWWLATHGRRVCWPGVGWLARRPPLAVLVVSAGVAGAGPEAVAPWAFVVVLVSAGWLSLTWPATSPRMAAVGGTFAESTDRRRLGSGSVGVMPVAGEVVRRSGPCPHCGGLLVAELRVPADPAAIEGVVARAACQTCRARLVGVVDPDRPGAGLVWLPLPDIDEWVEVQ